MAQELPIDIREDLANVCCGTITLENSSFTSQEETILKTL